MGWGGGGREGGGCYTKSLASDTSVFMSGASNLKLNEVVSVCAEQTKGVNLARKTHEPTTTLRMHFWVESIPCICSHAEPVWPCRKAFDMQKPRFESGSALLNLETE